MLYAVYTPHSNSAAHLVKDEMPYRWTGPSLCGFKATLGWFDTAPTVRYFVGRHRPCPKCERKRPVPSEAYL